VRSRELLQISEHTVERHREHILDKLELRDRVVVTGARRGAPA
jgi:DNA-binding NarL/FixJ family response regulator